MINYEIFNKDFLEYKFLRRIAECLSKNFMDYSSIAEMADAEHELLKDIKDLIFIYQYSSVLDDKINNMFDFSKKEISIKNVILNINENCFFELQYDYEPGYNTKMFSLSYCYHDFYSDEDEDDKIVKNKEVFKDESKLFEALYTRIHSNDISEITSLEDTPNFEFK